jgi:hypothetical protein
MKRVVLIAVALMLAATVASYAQQGSIMVFTNTNANSCDFIDLGDLSVVRVYIYHMYTAGSGASQWMLEVPADWEFIGDTKYYTLVIGTSTEGCAVSYGGCASGDLLLIRASFFGSPLIDGTPACTYISIVAAPGQPGVRSVDCVDNSYVIPGGQGIVNSDGTCDCDVPVSESTWGAIKAQYN